jgi:hypothetical protein
MVNNGQLSDRLTVSEQFSQAVAAEHPDAVSVPTTAAGAVVPIGAVAGGQEGMVMMFNLDQTNYVEVGLQVSGTFYPKDRLDPGSSSRPGNPLLSKFAPGVTWYWRANTAACLVKMMLLQK